MRIGEVAERAGVSVRALRYYEEQALVIADRSPSGHRQYPESAVERVKFIQLLYGAGLTSRTILQILPFLDTLVATPEMTQQLRGERDRIQAKIDSLNQARERLDELIRLATDLAAAALPATCQPGADVTPVGRGVA